MCRRYTRLAHEQRAPQHVMSASQVVCTTLKLFGISLSQFDGAARSEFASSLQAHIAMPGGRVTVLSARAGSVVVECAVVPPPGTSAQACCDAVAQSLQGYGAAAFASALGDKLGEPLGTCL